MVMINKSIVTPLYMQVADKLREEILSKQYGENGCIGTHAQLTERFSVSLRTIRAAVQLLEKEGLVDIRQGKGTFVRGSVLIDRLQDLTGISNMLYDMNVEKEIRIPVFQLMTTPSWLAPDVKAALGEKCLFIRRIVVVDGSPAANADMYLPQKFFSLFSKEDVTVSTVYQVLEKKLGVELGRGSQIIRAVGASKELAADMQLPVNAPVLEIRRKAYDKQKNLIEYMILSYEASKYCFEVELDLHKRD